MGHSETSTMYYVQNDQADFLLQDIFYLLQMYVFSAFIFYLA